MKNILNQRFEFQNPELFQLQKRNQNIFITFHILFKLAVL